MVDMAKKRVLLKGEGLNPILGEVMAISIFRDSWRNGPDAKKSIFSKLSE